MTTNKMTPAEESAAERERIEKYVADLPSAEEMAKPVVSLVYDLHEMADVVSAAAVLADNTGPAAATLVRLIEDLGALVEAAVSACIAGSARDHAGRDVRRALEHITQVHDLRLQHYADRAWSLAYTVGK